MTLDENEIKVAIAEGKITAITLDTSIFDGNGNRFEHGLLARLNQFKNTAIDFLLSDVVVGEVKAHVARAAAEAQSKVRSAVKDVGKAWQVPPDQREAAVAALFGAESPEQLADRRMNTFAENTAVEIVECFDRVDVSVVLAAYFSSTPPFGKSVSKKSEFPDALALHSLEHWAESNETLLLAVSKDGDWQRYCKSSKHLVIADDLASALSYFHQNAEVACSRLAERFNAGDLDIESDVERAINQVIDRMSFIPDVSSGYFFDAEVYGIDVTFVSVRDDGDGQGPFKVVDKPDEKTLVVEAEVEVSIEVSTSFRFWISDPIDNDEVPHGSASATKTIEKDFRVLLTFEGDLAGDADLVDVEVDGGGRRIEVDYGEVGPDWDHEPTDE